MKTAIIIPARYGSTRFPGKPLAVLKGIPVLQRVYNIATEAAKGLIDITIHVATDDNRIAQFCHDNDIPVLMTPVDCQTGTDRAMAAVNQLAVTPDFVINLQGDAPLTPADFVRSMIDAIRPGTDIVTPVTRLTWDELDQLRQSKQTTPFSGTTAIVDETGRALWFSKNIIPAIRKEADLREKEPMSPVYRHIGLYGYALPALQKFVQAKPSFYEELEGLEQLRAIEMGLKIQAVQVDYKGRPSMTGIDSPEDLARAEKLLF